MMIAIDNHSSFGNHLFRLRTRINFPEQILLLGDVHKIENEWIYWLKIKFYHNTRRLE